MADDFLGNVHVDIRDIFVNLKVFRENFETCEDLSRYWVDISLLLKVDTYELCQIGTVNVSCSFLVITVCCWKVVGYGDSRDSWLVVSHIFCFLTVAHYFL